MKNMQYVYLYKNMNCFAKHLFYFELNLSDNCLSKNIF